MNFTEPLSLTSIIYSMYLFPGKHMLVEVEL